MNHNNIVSNYKYVVSVIDLDTDDQKTFGFNEGYGAWLIDDDTITVFEFHSHSDLRPPSEPPATQYSVPKARFALHVTTHLIPDE